MYGRILVTLDGSPLSEAVLPQVEQLVTGTDTSVTLLRVAELPEQTVRGKVEAPPPLVVVGGGTAVITEIAEPELRLVETRGQAFERVKEEIKGYLSEKAHALRNKGVEVDSESRLGPPAESIIDYAATHEVDLIMMSTHGRTGLGRMLFGSVAASVLKSGVKPVLLVRPGGLE